MKKYPWTSTFVFCFLVFAALAAFKVSEIQAAMAFAASFPEPSATVKTHAVETRDYRASINVIGTVRSPKDLALHNELAGKITKLNMPSGGRIEKGQLLMQLDISTEAANINSLQAQRKLARSEAKRMQSLRKRDAVSQQQLDKALTDIQVLSANIAALEATIDKKTLRAPFNGQVGIHQWQVGEFVARDSLVVNLLGDSETVWVHFQVPQFYPVLAVGSTVDIFDTNGNAIAKATISVQDTLIDPRTRSRRYRAEISDAGNLRSNSTVQVAVPTGKPSQVNVVPNSSLLHDPVGDYVFVLSPDAEKKGFRAERRDVVVEKRQGGEVYLNEGLAAGETVAADGAFKLREGLLVFKAS